MASRPYRAASRQTPVWLAICLTGLLTPIALLVNYGSKDTSPWFFGLVILSFILSLVIATVVTGWLKRGRFGRIAAWFHPTGMDFVLEPTQEQKEAFLAPLARLVDWMDLRLGAKGIEWYAEVPHPQGGMRVFEYEYVTGSGKAAQIHMVTIVGWPATRTDLPVAALGHLDGFRAWRMTGWLRGWIHRKHELKDAGFGDLGKRWQLNGSAATGLRFFSKEVRGILENSPLGETWFVGGGWVCCHYKQPMEPRDLEKFIRRAEAVLRSPI